MAQSSKTCPYCKKVGHSGFYCPDKPRKPIKRTAIKTQIRKVTKKPKVKRVSRSQLVKKLDAVFSKWVRQRDDGKGCVTCGDMSFPKEQMQNCHFYSRGRLPTRWDETNCHSGCYRCNVLLKGNYIAYTMYMIDRYGREYVDNLEIKSKSNIKITSVELTEMIEKYTKLLTITRA